MKYVDRRELGRQKREAIRRHRPWKNPNEEPKKPNKSMRISMICIVLVIFFAVAVKAPVIVQKSVSNIEDELVAQAIAEGKLEKGICRVISGNRMLIILDQDNTEFYGVGAKVIGDILFIKMNSREAESPQEPKIYEIKAKELISIELFVNDINRPFDAIYLINALGELEEY